MLFHIKSPLITEKSLLATAKDRFTFKVALNSSKHQIKQIIEKLFNVSVLKVRTSIVSGETKRNAKGKISRELSWKKAIVQLKSGEKIDLFDTKTTEK